MLKKIVIILLIVWLLIFITDVVSANTIHHPIFCITGQGGCMTPYYGLGYSITFYYENSPNGVYTSAPEISMWVYFVLNVIVIAVLFIRLKKRTA